MNWTGGALGRSRGANTSLNVIQKKHFAKVRGRRNTNKHPKHPIQIFDFPDLIQRKNDLDTRGQNQYKNHGDRRAQKRLEPFEVTKSIVEPPPRSLKGHRTPIDDDGDHQSQHILVNFDSSLVSISSRSSSSASPEPESEDHAPQACSDDDETHDTSALDPIEAQRRRLLRMSNWVGINHTRPATINFPTIEDRDQIGKRRRLSQLPKYDQSGSIRKRPRRTGYFERLVRSPRPSQDYLSQADVSVRIGSAVDRGVRDDYSRYGLSTQQQSSTAVNELLLEDEVAGRGYSSPKFVLQGEQNTKNVKTPQRRVYTKPTPPTFTRYSLTSSLRDRFEDITNQEGRAPSDSPPNSPINTSLLREGRDGPSSDGPGQIGLIFNYTPTAATERSQRRSSSPNIRNLAWQQKTNNEQLLQAGRYAPRASPLRSIASNDSAILQAFGERGRAVDTKEWLTGTKFDDSSPARPRLERLSSLNNERYAKRDSKLLCIPWDEHATLENPTEPVDEEEAMWKAFVNMDGEEDQRQTIPTQKPTFVHHNPIPPQHCLPDLRRQCFPQHTQGSQAPDKACSPPPAPQRAAVDPIENEELMWRKFVFGDDEVNSEWKIEEPDETEYQDETSSPTHPSRTQQSTIAEIATSPIKHNPHSAEEASETNMSPVAEGDNASMIAQVDTGSVRQDEKLDNLLVKVSPDLHSRTDENVHGHATNEQGQVPPIPPCPSSLKAQASASSSTSYKRSPDNAFVTQTSVQAVHSSETDPLAWSPARISSQQTQSARCHQHNRNQAAIIFRKPPRYVGERSSDPGQPMVLGPRWSSRQTRVDEGGEDTKGLGYCDEIEDA
ncbi:MAG: hypothetical protein Q9217_004454 [Psora testacea]